MIGSAALDGERKDLTGLLVGLVLRLLLVFLDLHGLFVPEFFLSLRHEHGTGFLRRKAGDALEFGFLLLVHRVDGLLALVEARLLAREVLLALLQGLQLAVELILFLGYRALLPRQLVAPLLGVFLQVGAQTVNLFLCFQQSFFFSGFAFFFGVSYNLSGLFLGGTDLCLSCALAHHITSTGTDDNSYYYR